MACWVQKIALTRWIAYLSVSAVLFTCTGDIETLPYYNTPEFDPLFIESDEEVSSKISHQIADFSFVDQDGATITQRDIEGKIHVANFIFTSCISICPKMTDLMQQVDEAFADDKDVVILSYSVTPWIDNVARLHEYALANDISSTNWHLLTGDRGKIYELARKSYFAEEDLGFTRDSTEFLHTEHLLLVDKSKRIRGIYNGTLQLEIEQLIKDIAVLSSED
jgi:protein SCO1